MNRRFFLIAILITSAQPSYAMFCPNNFNQINIGDSIKQVQTLCGKPDTEKKYDVKKDIPQDWTYYVKAAPNAAAPLKMSIAFNNNTVINISVSSISITSTQLCGGHTVKLGDTLEYVKSTCGNPGSITENQQLSGAPEPATKMTEFTYNTTPPVTLVFEGDTLKERK